MENLNDNIQSSSSTMLSAKEIIDSKESHAVEIPSFGVKDFEPDGSAAQSCEIQNSILEFKKVISHGRVKLLGTLSQAVWQPELQLAEVTHQIGSCWTYVGHKIGQKLYIYPEEALYLLEAGCLQLIYNGVPLSVQRAYFVLFSLKDSITIEKYRVYSLLSSCGYKVLRHSPQNTVSKYEKQIEVHKIGLKLKDYHSSKNVEKRHKDVQDDTPEITKKVKVDDVVTFPIVYEEGVDETEILKMAQIVQPYENNGTTNLTFHYDVYSEASEKSFKKSCLQLPNFRVVVHRGEDSTADVEELCKLSNKYKDEVPVIHGIVFSDCVTFFKLESMNLPDI